MTRVLVTVPDGHKQHWSKYATQTR